MVESQIQGGKYIKKVAMVNEVVYANKSIRAVKGKNRCMQWLWDKERFKCKDSLRKRVGINLTIL